MSSVEIVSFSDVTDEVKDRAGDTECRLNVYGIDKTIGLTSSPRYQSKNLQRYKIIENGMFAYNPMRLNIGSIGFCHRNLSKGLVSPDYVVFKTDEKFLIPEFFNYHTKTENWLEWVSHAGEGSVRERIYYSKLSKYKFKLPSLEYQRKAVKILNTFDNKIENNEQINETLEGMARAIFKSWFVNFDPVQAKVNGHAPMHMDTKTAALFPTSFNADGLPAGWRQGRISDLAHLNTKTLKPSEFADSYIEHYSIPAFDAGKFPAIDFGKTVKSNKTIVPPNSVLLSKLNPNIERVWLPIFNTEFKAVSSTEFLVLTEKGIAKTNFLYSLFRSRSFLARYERLVTGTSNSHQRVRPQMLLDMKVTIPSSDLIETYSNCVSSMFEKIRENQKENQTLAELRDTLLPKLISGAIRIRDAEREVEVGV